ncbi:Mitochondrial acidic protein mam33 [Vanrija albida]|uniref:Mitochondrial acidic protein mam33 n=1 Tax=Vanrija albida TaxID=181172 RepID=A0ABR3PX42_9TREE
MSALRVLRPALRAALRAPRAAARPVPAFAVAARSFHATLRASGSGETDGELAAALAAEHAYETESASDEKPEFFKNLEQDGVWAVKDIPGSDDVIISRKFGDEHLKLTFQVSDLDNAEPVESVDADGAVIEDAVEPAYITSSLLVTKGGSKKALLIDLAAQPDGFEVTNVAVYEKGLAEQDGADADWQRRSKYMGPQFDTLDTAVQDAFQNFLHERGVDEALANFVVSYSEYKEQKDYVTWLADLKDFVNA